MVYLIRGFALHYYGEGFCLFKAWNFNELMGQRLRANVQRRFPDHGCPPARPY